VNRVVIACLLVGCAAAACTSGTTPAPPVSSSPPGGPPVTSSASPSATDAVPGLSIPLEVWFERDGKLFETTRTVHNTVATGRAALEQLLAGPSDAERAAGVSSRVADGTTLTSLSIANGVAHVSLSSPAETDPLADAQIVYTLSQFPTVQRVIVNNQEGGPLSPHDLAGQLPAIVVASPSIGATVGSPLTISGSADVFEATVSIRILDQQGHRIADTFATASCGSGCRGTYSKSFTYSLASSQPGTIVVFEASGETGQPIHVQKIPVFLHASA